MNAKIYFTNGDILTTSLEKIHLTHNGSWVQVDKEVGYSYYPREQVFEIAYLGE